MFEKSAEQAGYFEHGKTRLVMPAGGVKDDLPPSPKPPQDEARRDRDNNGGNGGRNPPGLHPFIQGLLDTLPSIPNPREKPEWPAAERAKWLQTAANIFDLIYAGDGGITVSAARADRSPRPQD